MFFRPTTTTPRQRRHTDGQLMGYLAIQYLGLILKAMYGQGNLKSTYCVIVVHDFKFLSWS